MSEAEHRGRPVYSIGAVAKMLSVSAATLRTWQERYGVVVPVRSEGGHRLYTRDQVEQLRFVVDRVSAGLSPADAHRLLRDQLTGGGSLRPPEEPPRDGLLIVLAEDDPYTAEFAEYFLRTEGFDVALAEDAPGALRKVAELEPQLAVVDLLIGSGKGVDLCAQLHGRWRLPVVAISTLDTREPALAAGAAAFLLKPVNPLQLVSAVRDLLGHSAMLRSTPATDGHSP